MGASNSRQPNANPATGDVSQMGIVFNVRLDDVCHRPFVRTGSVSRLRYCPRTFASEDFKSRQIVQKLALCVCSTLAGLCVQSAMWTRKIKNRNAYKERTLTGLPEVSAIANWALIWIYLHEGHVGKTLSGEDSFLGGMAASSPSGDADDPELDLWEAGQLQHTADGSLAEFRSRVEFTRHRLRALLEAVEPFLQAPASHANTVDGVLSALRVAYSECRELHRSPVAWQDIHAEDAELMSRAALALRKLGG